MWCWGSNPGLLLCQAHSVSATLVVGAQTRTHSHTFQMQTKPLTCSLTHLSYLTYLASLQLFCLDQHPEVEHRASWEGAQVERGWAPIHFPSVLDFVCPAYYPGRCGFRAVPPPHTHSMICSSEDGKQSGRKPHGISPFCRATWGCP